MPTAADQDRSIHQHARLQVLDDEWDDLVAVWLGISIDPERSKTWGMPDTSANPLGDQADQLTTPGLYGVRPTMLHAMQHDAADVLIGARGALVKAGHWTKMQSISYFTVGMGDFVVRIDAPPDVGRLTLRPVNPHDVYIKTRADTPEEIEALWELRLRWYQPEKRWMFVWEQYDISDPEAPFYRIVEAETDGGEGMDVSNVFLATDDNPGGDFTGEHYPYRFATGEAFIPWTMYRAVDVGRPWNHHHNRGLYIGTLNAAVLATYAMYCAKACTGDVVIIAGLQPVVSAKVKSPIETGGVPGVEMDYSASGGVQTVTIEPGTIMYHSFTDPGVQPVIKQVGAGGALQDVAAFARGYSIDLAARRGGGGADVTRQHANPTSGSSLAIQNEGRRVYARQVTPLFERADLELAGKAAAVLNRSGIEGTGSIPEDGYSISYAPIPKSPQERKEDRDGIDWSLEHGFLSETKAYQQLNPGTSEDDARMAIVRARVEAAKLDQLTAEMMAAAGVAPPSPPEPPTPEPPSEEEETDDL